MSFKTALSLKRPLPSRTAATAFATGTAGLLFAMLSVGCGAGAAPSASPSAAAPKNSLDAGDATSGDGGAENERAFAGSTAEATSLISVQVDKRGTDIGTCVREFRGRRKLAHERVSVSFGIDQDGRVLGVTSKGKEDAELKACVQEALKGASFPRSHAGVITVTKTYEDLVQ